MVLSLVTIFTEQVFAELTTVVHQDNQVACDTLVIPEEVDELGNKPPFPDDEWIVSLSSSTDTDACPPISSNPLSSNMLVSITNNSPFDFSDLWYVVNSNIGITNFDGGAGPDFNTLNRAFKIDSVGVNKPLVKEMGGAVAGVFESGETWEFIIDDFPFEAGDPAAFLSIGVPSTDSESTGSIIAIPIKKFVGGEFIAIDTAAVLLAGAQMTSAWLVPFIVAAIGIGIVLARKF